MIKRIIYDDAGKIKNMLDTNIKENKVTNDFVVYYDVVGTEKTLSDIVGLKKDLIEVQSNLIRENNQQIILNDFEFEDHFFTLDLESQFNYQSEFFFRDKLTYPRRIKDKNNEDFTLTSADHYAEFYQQGMVFKTTVVEEGWALQDSLQSKSEIEIIKFKDPRV